MTDLCYIVLTYWDLVKPTYRAIKEVLKEDLASKYAALFPQQHINFDYEPAQ